MEKSIDKRNMAQVGSFLGIDFGRSKIGLSIADEETKMAFAYDTIANDTRLMENLKLIAAKENIGAVVVGMTSHAKDPKGFEEKQEFGRQLEKNLGLPIYFQEEMFTTKMAQENLKMHLKKPLASKDDQESARIILQSWLDCLT
jgi:putative transcription antitermination factor YqgF